MLLLFHIYTGIKKINDNGAGYVSSVELNDGQILKCDILFCGIGSTYFTDFLKGSGIAMQPDGSVETNEFLQTNIPNVYAGGDIAYAPVWSYHNRKVAIGKFSFVLLPKKTSFCFTFFVKKNVRINE